MDIHFSSVKSNSTELTTPSISPFEFLDTVHAILSTAIGYQAIMNSQEVENKMNIFVFLIAFVANPIYNIRKETMVWSMCMEISYKKLWILLIEKDISPATLRKDLNIATGTMTKMRRNEDVALSLLLRICEYLDCNIGDICDAVKVDRE